MPDVHYRKPFDPHDYAIDGGWDASHVDATARLGVMKTLEVKPEGHRVVGYKDGKWQTKPIKPYCDLCGPFRRGKMFRLAGGAIRCEECLYGEGQP